MSDWRYTWYLNWYHNGISSSCQSAALIVNTVFRLEPTRGDTSSVPAIGGKSTYIIHPMPRIRGLDVCECVLRLQDSICTVSHQVYGTSVTCSGAALTASARETRVNKLACFEQTFFPSITRF